jgi:primase-polymerase (primpol)-like protein
MAGKNGTNFPRLWAGNISPYPSWSEATLALCGMLAFWTRGDAERVDHLFRKSGLMRDKWDEFRVSGT